MRQEPLQELGGKFSQWGWSVGIMVKELKGAETEERGRLEVIPFRYIEIWLGLGFGGHRILVEPG